MKKLNVDFISILLGLLLILGSFPTVYAQGNAEEEFTLEEITVTAEKRTVDIQKTALAVTAVTGSDITDKAIANVSDVLDGLAAVKVMGGPMGGKIFIRGIGSNIDTNMASPSVSLQKDNVYLGQSEAVLGSLYDVDRVEVLYGPQGTMYGNAAAGGQVNVITKNPVMDRFEANGSISVGAYNLANYSAALNLPLASKLSARVALNQDKHDGYISDGSSSSDKFASRVKLLYKPTERISVLFSTEFSWDKSSNMNTVPVPGSAGNIPKLGPPPGIPGYRADYGWVVPDANGDGYGDDLISPDPNRAGSYINTPNGITDLIDTGWQQEFGGDAWTNDIYHPAPRSNNRYQLYSLQIDADMGWSKLTLIPTLNRNYRNLWSELIMGTSRGGNLFSQEFREKQMSAEMRLSNGSDSKLIWTVGGYWFKSDNKRPGEVETDLYAQAKEIWDSGSSGGGAPPASFRGVGGSLVASQGPPPATIAAHASDNLMIMNYMQPQDSLAFFGQATYPITDRFRLTGGMRWSNDTNNMKMRVIIYDVSADGAYSQFYTGDDTTVTTDGRHEYDTGIFIYELKASPTQYKGGFEFDLDANKMLYATVSTGFKRGGLNTLGTYPPVPFDPEEVTNYSMGLKSRWLNNTFQLNAEAYYYDYTGYQVQYQGQFYDPIRKQMAQGMLIANADKGTNSGIEISPDWMITANDRLKITLALMKTEFGNLILPPGPFNTDYCDLTGTELPKAPKISGTLAYEHTFNLEDGATITPSFSTKISGGFWNTHEKYLAGSYTDSYTMSDVYVTYADAAGKYSASLWVKNIENSVVTDYTMPIYRRVIMAPRTSGVTLSVKF